YFAADWEGGEAVARCFTEAAVVKDEGRTHRGRAAIKQWKEEVSTRYQYTSEPFACDTSDGIVVVTCRLTGTFPGSPVNLRFFFRREGAGIAALETTPGGAVRGERRSGDVRRLPHPRRPRCPALGAGGRRAPRPGRTGGGGARKGHPPHPEPPRPVH